MISVSNYIFKLPISMAENPPPSFSVEAPRSGSSGGTATCASVVWLVSPSVTPSPLLLSTLCVVATVVGAGVGVVTLGVSGVVEAEKHMSQLYNMSKFITT